MAAASPWYPRRADFWTVVLVGVVSLALGCASAGVRIDYDHRASFAGLRTYAWIDSAPIAADSLASPFLNRRVRRAVDLALRSRGLLEDSAGRPGFLVTALVIGPTRSEADWSYWPERPCGAIVAFSFGRGYPFAFGLHQRRWPWQGPYYQFPWGYACSFRVGYGYVWLPVYQEPQERIGGTLVIDILEPHTRDLIWRGSLEGALPPAREISQEDLDTIAVRILEKFPPR